MKKRIYLLVYVFISMTWACSNEKAEQQVEGNGVVLTYTGDNSVGKVFVEMLGRKEYDNTKLLEYLGETKMMLLDYAKFGWIGQYGVHFTIPICERNSKMIEEYLICQIDVNHADMNFVIVNEQFLNKIDRGNKFLYSKHFLDWKNKGLNVKSEMYVFAEKLDGKVLLLDEAHNALSRSNLASDQFEGYIRYYIDCSNTITSPESILGVTYRTRYEAFEYGESEMYMAYQINASWMDVYMDHVKLKITSRSFQDDYDVYRAFEAFVGGAQWFLAQEMPGVRIDYSIDVIRGTGAGGGSSEGGGGITGGGSTSGTGSESTGDAVWWAEGHKKILRAVLEKLDLDSDVIDAINEGSKMADKSPFQETKYAYMHAMRSPRGSEEDAIRDMRNFFEKQIDEYYVKGDIKNIGMALHPIMDAYSPAHDLRVWNGKAWDYIPHCFEASFFYYKKIQKAQDALQLVCDDLFEKGFFDRPNVVFNNWLYGPYGPRNPKNMK